MQAVTLKSKPNYWSLYQQASMQLWSYDPIAIPTELPKLAKQVFGLTQLQADYLYDVLIEQDAHTTTLEQYLLVCMGCVIGCFWLGNWDEEEATLCGDEICFRCKRPASAHKEEDYDSEGCCNV